MKWLALVVVAYTLPVLAAEQRCRPIPGSEAVLTKGARVVLGEMHGNHETQRFVADLACLAEKNGPLRVGLEIPDDEQPRLDAYVASAGSADDRKALLEGAFWKRDTQDGRSSVAMVALLEALRQRKRAGVDVDIVAFDVPPAFQGDRELGMATRLDAAFRRDPAATFVVLVGNLHARKAAHPEFPQTFMSQHLVKKFAQRIRTLDVRYGAGTSWVCMPECGVHEIGRGPPPPVGITLGATPDGAYDGTFSIGAPTAAKPAR